MKEKLKKPGTFWKILLVITMLHGMICVTLSYILAWTGHDQTVEMVSQTLVTEILAPFVAGMITKTVENVFEKNKLSFSEPIKDLEKIRETEYADDISEIGGEND